MNLRQEDERNVPPPLNDPRTTETLNCCLWPLYHFIIPNYRVRRGTSSTFIRDKEELGPQVPRKRVSLENRS